MARPKSDKGRYHVAMLPSVAKRLKIMAIQHDVYPGDIVEAGLQALEAMTTAQRAALLASFDHEEGEIVPEGESEAATIERSKGEHATHVVGIENNLHDVGKK